MKNAWQLLKRSLKGEHHDYTSGSISDAVILLAIPMILELSLESVFAVVDMFFVSRLGANAIATVGLTESVITIIYSISIGIATGATAVVARRIGEKNPEGAAHAGAQSLLLGVGASLIISAFGAYYASDILRLMGASPEVIAEGTIFTRIMMGGSSVILLLFLINGIFRGAGDAAMAMKSLWIASGVNIVLCPIFIHLWGIKGAAIATVAGRTAGVIYQCIHLFDGRGVLKFTRQHFWFDAPVIKTLMSIAWPASVQFMIGSGSWIILTWLVAQSGGTAASAGYQIAFRCFVFFFLPAWGLSNAAATLVGQNLGAKEIERAKQSVYMTNKFTTYVMTLFMLLFIFLPGPMVSMFTRDPDVARYGIEAMQWIGAGFIFFGIGMVMTQALNGAGDTRGPTWMNFIAFWAFQTPASYFLVKHMNMGPKGAILVTPFAHGLLALMAWWTFRRGRWQETKV